MKSLTNKEVERLVELNKEADKNYYELENSKQELIKMKENDYDVMKNKNSKLRNELETLELNFKNTGKHFIHSQILMFSFI